ncbi:MAG: hypothetical protein E7253_02235 [Lachnospiraceae bacterium]|nr:hypothetical protein [Lachnospiraceae bacterium]
MKKVDFHIHLTPLYPVEKSVYNLKEMCRRNGYETFGLQTLTHGDSRFIPKANETAFKVKQLIPECILFAGPVHDGTSYVEQVKNLMEQGADGIKLLIGKPSEYRDLNVKYSDPIIDAFFAYAEKEDIPVLLHHNDPEKHWDKTKMSKESIDRGWYYDPQVMPSCHYFDQELEKLLAKYPNLRIAVAHMGFYSNKLDRLTELMKRYPKLYMDITPALDIYEDLSKEQKKSQKFFEHFSDRLIYGTDAWSDLGENEKNRKYNEKKVKIVEHFLCGECSKVIDGQFTASVKLTKEQQEDIYYNNCMKFIRR